MGKRKTPSSRSAHRKAEQASAGSSNFFSDLINVFAESLEPVQKPHPQERDLLGEPKDSPEGDDFGDGWEKVSH